MTTLYEAFVPTSIQMLEALAQILDKAEAHCADNALAPEALLAERLAPDMYDFAYQVKSSSFHSIGAIKGVDAGHVSPDKDPAPSTFPALKAQVLDSVAQLKSVDPSTFETLGEKKVLFTVGDRIRWEFTGANFLLGFAQPNFYFHVTTAYAILRAAGVKIGKVDYLGQMRHE